MELILRNAIIAGGNGGKTVDIGIEGGKIAAIEANLAAEGEELDVGGRMVGPGFIESHIHLDKSCILERCKSEKGHLDEAIEQVANAKKQFTPEDCRERAVRTLEKSRNLQRVYMTQGGGAPTADVITEGNAGSVNRALSTSTGFS